MASMLDALRGARAPVALTGAGISAPSGVPTYQDAVWQGRPIRDFLTRAYLRHNPIDFFALLCQMEAWTHAAPNAAHLALARAGTPVITQNVDGLHQRAGSQDVIELHGTLRAVRCHGCGATLPTQDLCARLRPLYAAGDLPAVEAALRCACGSLWDTDVVLYGDSVRGMDKARGLLAGCDLLLVIGTTLETYPASLLPEMARWSGARVLMENRDCVAALTEA